MNKKYTDLMIDWETMSTHTNAQLLQLGMCFFDADDESEQYASSEFKLDQTEQVEAGRHASKGTIAFWEGEDQILLENLKSGTYTMEAGSMLFRNTYKEFAAPGCRVWGNGSSFDETLLRSMLEQTDNPHTPYAFWKVRDMRTMLEQWPVEKVKAAVKHDGESDAIAQAMTIKKCFALAKKTKDAADRMWLQEAVLADEKKRDLEAQRNRNR